MTVPPAPAAPSPQGEFVTGSSTPVPDPTVLTQAQIDRALQAEREWTVSQLAIRDQRMDADDVATKLRLSQFESIMPAVNEKVAYERGLTEAGFAALDHRLHERDMRFDGEGQNRREAVTNAFAAQEKVAQTTNDANQKAIDKSEASTNESIRKLDDAAKAANAALSDKIDDIKARMGIMDATLIGMVERTAGGKETTTDNRATVAYIMAGILFMITIGTTMLALFSNGGP